MELNELRNQIDCIDDRIAALLEERMAVVEQVGELKKRTDTPILHTDREQSIIDRLTANARDKDVIASVYRYLFEISRIRQAQQAGAAFAPDATRHTSKVSGQNATVACQGTVGAYSALARETLFPDGASRFYERFEDVAAAVTRGETDYGILPTHNSNAGSVLEVYDLMTKYNVYIVNSLKLKVSHCLLGIPGARKEDIAAVYSHPQGLSQCRGYIAKSLPGAEAKLAANTALAAEFVSKLQDPRTAAIASEACAERFSLSILERNIQDSDFNYTNFVVLARQPNLTPENGKISVIVSIPHEPGSLYRLLTKFYVNNLNLTKIESRPIPGKDFEFLFYLDFDGNALDAKTAALLSTLERELPYFKFLGNY